MHIVATQVEKAVLLKVSGRMDADNADEFDKACEVWISKGAKHLIADLADLQYVSSMGLRLAASLPFRSCRSLWRTRSQSIQFGRMQLFGAIMSRSILAVLIGSGLARDLIAIRWSVSSM